MMNFNTRTKSAMLALVMIPSSCFVYANDPQVVTVDTIVYSNPVPAFTTFIKNHKFAFAIVVALITIGKIQLKAKGAKHDYKLEDWSDDVTALLGCYNIFDINSYKTVMHLIDKWIVGRRLKILEKTTRTKKEDGSVVTIKDVKLGSAPFGLVGLFDAYVLMHLKELTDYTPSIAAFCYLLTDPLYLIQTAQNKK